mmetsp:Transcript_3102/g.11246  ORF Transcript_3102/g.11246 Transcript_3102/m.11246 type:complete len:225 (-) Transcript_3102:437-1111(-)
MLHHRLQGGCRWTWIPGPETCAPAAHSRPVLPRLVVVAVHRRRPQRRLGLVCSQELDELLERVELERFELGARAADAGEDLPGFLLLLLPSASAKYAPEHAAIVLQQNTSLGPNKERISGIAIDHHRWEAALAEQRNLRARRIARSFSCFFALRAFPSATRSCAAFTPPTRKLSGSWRRGVASTYVAFGKLSFVEETITITISIMSISTEKRVKVFVTAISTTT